MNSELDILLACPPESRAPQSQGRNRKHRPQAAQTEKKGGELRREAPIQPTRAALASAWA